MIQLAPKQSKAAALALLVLVMALVAVAIATPVWLLNRRYDMAIEDATTRLQRYSKIAGMREGLQKKLADVRSLATTRHYLKNATPALAATELQELVKSILDATGGKLNSIQILPHKDEGIYRQVTVSLQLSAPLSALKPMLHKLESARPYLFIDNFSVRAPFIFAQRPANVPAPTAEPELTIQFDLTGYALKGTP